MTSDTTFVYPSHYPRPDWSPCSQPPNSGTPLNPPPDFL